eukprot:CAMPEP_0116866878 /NCGR_PEP_ID=MMETSP0418-20121206/26308_1 /TAXON_ID=1158023 /ORGANISM="Astrosyne radiata, Strain 13vi08-1A" /LENGTH=122 /DNA_ID=CAMNT_0004502631 /DNA_START=31 /DNA_END=399 /DNA_ORIENTATION=-
MIRCWCTKCQTPLGIEVEIGPQQLIVRENEEESPLPDYKPQAVLNFASARPGTKRSLHENIMVRDGTFAPLFLLRGIVRIILGILLLKGGNPPGGLLGGDYSNIAEGINAIKQSNNNKKKDE